MSEICQITYNGLALPLNGVNYVMFSTVDAGMGAGQAQANGFKKLTFAVGNDVAGTLNFYRGTRATPAAGVGVAGWDQVSSTAVAPAGAAATNMYEFLIESFPHFKLEWLNGAGNQTVFGPDIALVDERHAV